MDPFNDKSNLLSICILTYNRADLLCETLRSFIKEAAPYNIPIYVSNNCSTDHTIEVVTQMQQEYQNLHLHTNAENLGFDRNAMAAVQMSQSQYCWLFSDDDAIKEGAIKAVISHMEKGYDLLIVNASDYDKNLAQERVHSFWKDQDKIYQKGEHNQLFDDMVMYVTFVGCLVVNRQWWNSIEKDKYIGTAFVHLGTVFEYIVNRKAYYISEPYIKMRGDNSSWIKNKFKILNFTLPQTFACLTEYDTAVKLKHANINQQYSIKDLLRYKAICQYTPREYQMIKAHKSTMSFSEKIKLKTLAYCPVCLAMVIIRLKPKVYQRILNERELIKKQTSY